MMCAARRSIPRPCLDWHGEGMTQCDREQLTLIAYDSEGPAGSTCFVPGIHPAFDLTQAPGLLTMLESCLLAAPEQVQHTSWTAM